MVGYDSSVRHNSTSSRASLFHHPVDRLAPICTVPPSFIIEGPVRRERLLRYAFSVGDDLGPCYQRGPVIQLPVPSVYLAKRTRQFTTVPLVALRNQLSDADSLLHRKPCMACLFNPDSSQFVLGRIYGA